MPGSSFTGPTRLPRAIRPTIRGDNIEIRLILATILQHLVPVRSPVPIELQSGLNLYPKRGMPLIFEPP